MPKRVYLAGPIRALAAEDAYRWRHRAEDFLQEKGFSVTIPRSRTNEPSDEIVAKDLGSILISDIVLAHVPEGVSSFGTPMEIFFAAGKGKAVVLWGGNFEEGQMSPWLEYHCEAYCDELAEALSFIWKNYSD